jgi:arsenate reductase
MKKTVLFICTHNSARSQMAEGYLRARYGDRYEAFSAGTEVSQIHPIAIEVMREIGVDISGQRSKSLSEFAGLEMDLAVTLCDSARAACPFFPWAKETLHKEFPDPTGEKGADELIIPTFRDVRDRITRWVDEYFGTEESG